ncbi:peptidylprolyl isomerase [Arcobacter suis]|uniref:Periplasmic folding chaperone n=1 Tax=Arcobacter suis CECT 7833 TaxID=663365 RepID=A0AAD0WR72_9BACT|nr:peptidylprolyl isomerase [Arcobacter suis]AXX90027.1 putative periplasmic folding chaperone [Arcobacter suis CECT 7833]RWS47160.1 peptidylprolyl isomerase [Arcobacter suis]
MITWMQRHKKWLVITIWISTIAFVGAGFVGWGSYEYGKQGGVVAVVGDREVSVEEYQQEYSNLYEQYSKMFGPMFSKELAEQLKLKDVAYRQVLQKNLILSYADSLGLDITNEDIAKELVKYNVFLKDGKFDKETYIKVLGQNKMTPKDFEESLKRNLLLQKVQMLFELNPSNVEVENLSKLLFIEDDISIKILNSNDIKVDVKQEELKKYWEENKNSYMSEISYDLEVKELPLLTANSTEEDIKAHYEKFKIDYKHEDGKIKSLEEAKNLIIKDLDEKYTKTEALKVFLKIKKDEDKFETKVTYKESTLPFMDENNTKILESKEGEIVKPFFEKDKYFIVKLTKKNLSQTLTFEQASSLATKDYEKVMKSKKLEELATSQLKDFKGIDISTVSRDSVNKIVGLEQKEAGKFLNELFSSTSKDGMVKLEDKIVLYRINNSKFSNYNKAKDDVVKGTLIQLQEEELMMNLMKKLENSFEIQSSIQEKE